MIYDVLEIGSHEGDIVQYKGNKDDTLYYASISLTDKGKIQIYYGGPNVVATLDKRTAEGLLDALMQLLYNDLTEGGTP